MKVNVEIIHGIENNFLDPCFDFIIRIANALGVSTDYVIGRSLDMKFSDHKMKKLFRHYYNMLAEDQGVLLLFANILVKRNKKTNTRNKNK